VNKRKIVSTCALLALVVLIFVSATIFNFNLPMVTAAMPVRGYLNHVELTTGIARYSETVEIATPVSGEITAVLVQEGEYVMAGTPLFEMDFRGADDEIRRRMEDANVNFAEQQENIRVNRTRIQVENERTAINISNILQQIDELFAETDRPEYVSRFEISQITIEIERAEHELEIAEQMHEAGIFSAQELRNAQSNLENLRQRQSNAQAVFDESTARAAERLNEQAENRRRQIRNLEHQLEMAHQDQRVRGLELESLLIQESTLEREHSTRTQNYENALADFYESVITASASGVITQISINRGQHVSANQRLAALGQNLVIETEISLANTFVTTGSTARLYNSAHGTDGVVTVVNPHERGKTVFIEFESDAVSAGDTFAIQFSARSAESFVLVPNNAVNRDGDGYFLNQVRRRRGILGDEFFTERLRVYIGASDAENTAIIHGITFFEPLAVTSDRPFSERETIRLRNEADFFEN